MEFWNAVKGLVFIALLSATLGFALFFLVVAAESDARENPDRYHYIDGVWVDGGDQPIPIHRVPVRNRGRADQRIEMLLMDISSTMRRIEEILGQGGNTSE